MFADRESAPVRARDTCLVLVCVHMCVCPEEEFTLAAEVSRLRCKVEVQNGLINHPWTARNEHGARDIEEMIPQDHPPSPRNPPEVLLLARRW